MTLGILNPSSTEVPTSPTAWPPIQPVDRPKNRPPELPATDIPEPLRAWIVDEAERLGVPNEAVLIPALASAGALVGNTFRAYPKAHDERWSESPHLWGVLVASASTKKSPSLRAGTEFLEEIESDLAAEHEASRKSRRAAIAALETRIAANEKELVRHERSGDMLRVEETEKKLAELRDQLETQQAPAPRRMTNDTTVEKLAILAGQNPRGMLVSRDELSGLLEKMKSVGHENDRSFFLQGYNPDGRYTVDRVSRETVHVEPLTLTILGTIQPSVLQPYVRQAERTGGGDGFLARFQLLALIDPSDVGPGIDRAPDNAARNRARAVYRALEAMASANLERGERPGVHLDPDAQALMDDWRLTLDDEARLAARSGAGALEAHLGKAGAATVRLALVIHLLDRGDGATHAVITADQATQAIDLARFFLNHARYLYREEISKHWDAVEYIAAAVQDGRIVDGVKRRDLQTYHEHLKDGTVLDAALDTLEVLGWVRAETVKNPRARPSKVIHINPLLLPAAPALSPRAQDPMVS